MKRRLKPVEIPPILRASLSPRKGITPTVKRISQQSLSPTQTNRMSLNASKYLDVKQKLEFYDTYRKFYRKARPTKSRNKSDNPDLSYIKALERTHLFPETLGHVRSSSQTLDMSGLGVGDFHASALSHGMDQNESAVTFVNMRSNRLSGRGAAKIIQHLNPLVVAHIDLSYNCLGVQAMEALAKLLTLTSQLKKLYLESSGLSVVCIQKLMKGMEANISLLDVNLAQNGINEESVQPIASMLKDDQHLKNLNLNYNHIRGAGGAQIFDSLQENQTLLELNLGWNSVGGQRDSSAEAFANMVLRNDTLKHIDISYNRYNKAEVEIIAEALKANHTVLGMHVEGNAASYDPKGYLIAQDSISAPVIMSHRAKPSMKNCWICEGWKAIKVTWSPSEVGWSGKFLEKFSMRAKRMEPVYLHMETDGYDPCYMPKNSDTGEYELCRAIQPDQMPKFVISHRGKPKISSKFDFEVIERPIHKDMHFTENSILPMTVVCVQTIETFSCADQLDHEFEAIPRFDSDVERPEIEIPAFLEAWALDRSFFKDTLIDAATYEKCLGQDFAHSRIQKFVKGAEVFADITAQLTDHYPKIIECYKHYGSMSIKNENMFICYSELLQFLQKTGIMDEKSFRKIDFDVIFKAVNFTETESELNPTHGIVRYEFIETLVRVAVEKYMIKGNAANEGEALRRLFSEILDKALEDTDGNIWRFSRYACENMEIVFRTYIPVFQKLYDKYVKADIGCKIAYLHMEDFVLMCKELRLFDNKLGRKACYACYHKAMQPQADEITNARHLKMSFMEFLEALCRAIDVAEHLPILETIFDHWYLKEVEMKDWALDMKVEAMVPSIVNAFDRPEQHKILDCTKIQLTATVKTMLDADQSD